MPGRADFEVVGTFDQFLAALFDSRRSRSDTRRDSAMHCSTTSCPVAGSSAMTCSVHARPPAPVQLDAHEFETERLRLGFDHFGQAGDIGQSKMLSVVPESWGRPLRAPAPSIETTVSG